MVFKNSTTTLTSFEGYMEVKLEIWPNGHLRLVVLEDDRQVLWLNDPKHILNLQLALNNVLNEYKKDE